MFGINDNNDQAQGLPPEPTDHYASTPMLPDTPPPTGPAMSSHSHVNDADNAHSSHHPHNDDLMDIKHQALTSLTPLVDKIDQTPEEKFKTTMMLIQASDNSSLIKEAYAAANQIKDEKARAQALIDVINEINYFTQHQKGS